jgi:hypothetical protein
LLKIAGSNNELNNCCPRTDAGTPETGRRFFTGPIPDNSYSHADC